MPISTASITILCSGSRLESCIAELEAQRGLEARSFQASGEAHSLRVAADESSHGLGGRRGVLRELSAPARLPVAPGPAVCLVLNSGSSWPEEVAHGSKSKAVVKQQALYHAVSGKLIHSGIPELSSVGRLCEAALHRTAGA